MSPGGAICGSWSGPCRPSWDATAPEADLGKATEPGLGILPTSTYSCRTGRRLSCGGPRRDAAASMTPEFLARQGGCARARAPRAASDPSTGPGGDMTGNSQPSLNAGVLEPVAAI